MPQSVALTSISETFPRERLRLLVQRPFSFYRGDPPSVHAVCRNSRAIDLVVGSVALTQKVTLFTTTWCGYCVRLKSQLERVGIDYVEVDIESDPEAAALVATANDGDLTVPTLLFADGSTLSNPSIAQVSRKLASR
jgi:mycoredoxin